MLSQDQNIFVGPATDTDRSQFHSATIIDATGGGIIVELSQPVEDARIAGLSAGKTVGIYFEHRNKFMRQVARIDAVTSDDEKFTFGFTPTGEPVLADGRTCYRTTTLTENLKAIVDGQKPCPVLDVSSRGCSVRSKFSYKTGQTLSMSIEHDGTTYRGSATVQSIKKLGPNNFRYGLCCQGGSTANSLQRGLQIISTAVQRKQLKRLSGAA